MSPQQPRGTARRAACLLASAAALWIATIAAAQDADAGPFTDEASEEGEDTSDADQDDDGDDMSVDPGDEEETMSTEPDDEDGNTDNEGEVDAGDGGEGNGDGSADYEDLCSDSRPALYKGDCKTLQDGFTEPYKPKYGLWADGEAKDRFIHLVGKISASNANRWSFEKGTILYKTFLSSDRSRRLETRIIKKTGDGNGSSNWSFKTWGWTGDRTARNIANGETNWDGTTHNIPSETQCGGCHTTYLESASVDPILGFGAIQLNHDGTVVNDSGDPDGTNAGAQLTLRKLISGGRFSGGAPSTDTAKIPGNETEQQALGYLHANCGHCHSGSTKTYFELQSKVGIGSVKDTPAFKTAVCRDLLYFTAQPDTTIPGDEDFASTINRRIDVGSADAVEHSAVLFRMQSRDGGWGTGAELDPSKAKTNQMPPLATKRPHTKGMEWVRNWISGIGACP